MAHGRTRSVLSTLTDKPRSDRSTARGRYPLAQHDHLSADIHPLEQVSDVLVEHADAAVRGELADRLRLVGPMDGVLAPDSVMAAMPTGLLGASHVLVSEAKKPCRTPLATGLHQNRTAS